MRSLLKSLLLWILALSVTLVLAVFQRVTGPTYPRRLSVNVDGQELQLQFPRTHPGDGGLPVVAPLDRERPEWQGVVRWRRYPTSEPWQELPMQYRDEGLQAELPHLPPAGKLEYRVVLRGPSGQEVLLPAGEAVVARYRGEVGAAVLIPHILAMFASMLLSTRALLEVLRSREHDGRWMVLGAMVALMVGGLALGPMVQKQAFGAFWTGWPFGSDLTDNKTLLAFLVWLPATIVALRRGRTRWWVVAGWLVMTGVFLIPHSTRGSEVDWSEQPSSSAEPGPSSDLGSAGEATGVTMPTGARYS